MYFPYFYSGQHEAETIFKLKQEIVNCIRRSDSYSQPVNIRTLSRKVFVQPAG